MVAICRAWRLSARGNPPYCPKLEVWLWTMVFRPEEADGSKTRHSGSSVRSPVERDVPQHRADPSASEVGLQSNQQPLCAIPKGSGGQDRCAIHIRECVHDQSLASFSAQDCVPGLRFCPCFQSRCWCRPQQVSDGQDRCFHLSQLPDECQAQAAGCPWQPSQRGGVAGRALN